MDVLHYFRQPRKAFADGVVPVPVSSPPPATRAAGVTSRDGAKPLAGGRISLDSSATFLGSARFILPPSDADSSWRLSNLDSRTLDRMGPWRLMELLADLAPDLSRALWDFLRFVNPGWELTAYAPGTDTPHPAGQAALNTFLADLRAEYGTVDVPINRILIGGFLRGAMMGELVLDANARLPLTLATPDPATARFERRTDPVRGEYWQLGQWQAAKGFVPLERATVRYIPVDPLPGKPFGRSPAAPSLFTNLFLIGLLHDLRRVVAQQGYPRIDLAIDSKLLQEMVPPDVKSDPEKWQEWCNELVKDIQNIYTGLEPDDAFVHFDVVSVNRPVGAIDTQALGAVDGLIKALERMNARALKTMPFLMGLDAGRSETQANREYEAYAASIKSFQHLCESLLSYLFGLALQAQGIQATATFRFAELRAAELLRDAQVQALQVDTAFKRYMLGTADLPELAQEIEGHLPITTEPRGIPVTFTLGTNAVTNASNANPDPGANRAVGSTPRRRAAAPKFTPKGAGSPLLPVPSSVSFTSEEKQAVADRWDEAMPAAYRGLLDATVTGEDDA